MNGRIEMNRKVLANEHSEPEAIGGGYGVCDPAPSPVLNVIEPSKVCPVKYGRVSATDVIVADLEKCQGYPCMREISPRYVQGFEQSSDPGRQSKPNRSLRSRYPSGLRGLLER